MFNLKVIHRKGKYMSVPDALSRLPYNDPKILEELEAEKAAAKNLAVECDAVNIPYAFDFDITTDDWYKSFRTKILENPIHFPSFMVKNGKIFKIVQNEISEQNELKLLVPSDFREALIETFHSTAYGANLGFEKTLHRIRQKYYWRNMYVDIKYFVTRCLTCQRFKPSNATPKGLMKPFVVKMKPGH